MKQVDISVWAIYTKEAVVCLSLNFHILELNQVAEKIFGKTKDDIIGESYIDLCASIGVVSPFPEDVSQILSGQALADIEITFQDKQLVFAWTILRTLGSNCTPDGFMLIGQDITQLRETEAALLKVEDKLNTSCNLSDFAFLTGQPLNEETHSIEYTKSIYNYMENIVASLPLSVYWMNRQGVYLGCNDSFAALFNLKHRHEILGKTYRDLYYAESGQIYQTVDFEVMNSGISQTLEEPVFYSDGTKTIWLSSKAPLFNAAGQIVGMLGTSINITERKKMEQALQEEKERAEAASLAKSEFLAVVSHELRIPLTGILGMTQLLNTKNVTPVKQQEYLQHILSSGMHLLNLINDTLDFAKLEAAKVQLSSAPLDLKELIVEISLMLTPLAKAKNLELFIHFDQASPHNIFGDKRLLRQIIINLLGNAIKFTEHGYVSIQVECIEKTEGFATIAVSISDTGIGIPEEKQGMIFEFFSQVDSSHSRSHGGAGLGLTVTKQLIELMSGTISVDSQIGKGSTFHFVIEFPLQQESIVHYPWTQYESKVRILIVDDTPRGHVLQKQLSVSNSQVVSGSEAFNTLFASYQLSDPYNIVLFDQRIETVDLFALVESIQQHQELYQPMLVLLIDDGTAKTKEVAKASGFFECITKPIQPLALQVNLTAAWERWVEQREIRSLRMPIEKFKVLLVEDDEIVQLVHNNYLQDLNCVVDLASTGKEALEKLNNFYDLVFLDMGLPDISGIEVITEFRKRTIEKKQTPVISLTGYSAETDKQDFIQAGVDEVMVKPVFVEQLKTVIQKYCKIQVNSEQGEIKQIS